MHEYAKSVDNDFVTGLISNPRYNLSALVRNSYNPYSIIFQNKGMFLLYAIGFTPCINAVSDIRQSVNELWIENNAVLSNILTLWYQSL